jgi:hypothetical protein
VPRRSSCKSVIMMRNGKSQFENSVKVSLMIADQNTDRGRGVVDSEISSHQRGVCICPANSSQSQSGQFAALHPWGDSKRQAIDHFFSLHSRRLAYSEADYCVPTAS